MARTFRGGVHPPEEKHRTAGMPIETLPVPDEIVLPMQQHIGAPATPCVARRDEVLRGQVVGEPGGFVSAAVHATTSGTVKAVEPRPHPMRSTPAMAVVIEPDGEDAWAPGCDEARSLDGLDAAALRLIVQEAGLVGLGGATFPTHVKLSPPADKPIDVVVLNGVECEPFLTCDHRLMLETPGTIVTGLEIIMRILDVERGLIGIEANKPDAYETMRRAASRLAGVETVLLPVKYPQGGEKQLIKALLGREVPPPPALPMDVGVVVHNVATAHAIDEAVCRSRPLTERLVTVTGPGATHPGNYRVRIGAPMRFLAERAAGADHPGRLVLGGPMTGISQASLDVPVIKGTGGLLLLEAAPTYESRPCIRCGRCVDVCPAGINPSLLSILLEQRRFDEAQAADLGSCIKCGVCAYVCPARRPIVHLIKLADAELARRRAEERARQAAKAAS